MGMRSLSARTDPRLEEEEMTIFKGCPGAITLKEARPEYVNCPHCGEELEIWSDEIRVRCPHCSAWVTQERGASCIEWCAWAKECVGAELYERHMAARGKAKE